MFRLCRSLKHPSRVRSKPRSKNVDIYLDHLNKAKSLVKCISGADKFIKAITDATDLVQKLFF